MHDELMLFALDATRTYGEAVARELGITLAPHEEREFEDGEHKAPPTAVQIVTRPHLTLYVVQSLYADAKQGVNDKLVRLLFFLGALKDASAARLTAIVPYLAYARRTARPESGSVTTRYVATLFEAVGTDCVVTLDVHNLAAFQNAFRCRTDHLEAAALFRCRARSAARHGRACGRFARRRRHQARRGVPRAVVGGPQASNHRGVCREVSQRRCPHRRCARR